MENVRSVALRDVVPLLPEGRFERARRMSGRFPRVNLLVVGPDEAVEQVLDMVAREVDPDMASAPGTQVPSQMLLWRPGKPFELPTHRSSGTIVLRDVDTLVHSDQGRLADWLEQAAGRMQVVSTASASLMPLVDAGAFMQRLYYRLNTIYIDLTDTRVAPGDW